ncbi:penicillin-binding protein activator [Heliobacterium chlorum]|uniref:Penicillin-binding protein activator n=1 Tax=Heliobacterium chlorum TaxID=2698 RepID=A0ABR7T6G8_HELCL|nr:penicillin-binding protein activator [Heliobacterium chlorum]MBC9785439.1 penicillin-binding protein activator [Heliobacterium chlorum]
MIFITKRTLITVFGLMFLIPGLFYVSWMKAVSVMAPGKLDGPPIMIEVAVELTGPVAPWGQAAMKGVKMAVEEANQIGTNGRRFEITTVDANDTTGLSGIPEQVQKNAAVAVLGPITPSKAEALIKTGLKVPLVSLSTSPSIPTLGEKVVQGTYNDEQQGTAAAQYVVKSGYRQVLLVTEEKSAYAQSLAQAFQKTCEEQGAKMVKEVSYKRGQQDFSAILTEIQKEKADLIYLPGYAKEARAFLQQARQKGIETPIIGGDGLESVAKELANKEKTGDSWRLYYTTPNFIPTGQADEFIQVYQKRYNESPQPMALWAYEATRGLINALSTPIVQKDPSKLMQQMAISSWPVAGGRMRIDGDRHAMRPMAIMEFSSELRLVDVIPPNQ